MNPFLLGFYHLLALIEPALAAAYWSCAKAKSCLDDRAANREGVYR